MELRVLRYFLAVAREENITAAAESLHITQPTLSKQLMELEDRLGAKLFVRGNRKITLTEEGRFLRKRAQEILDLADKTEAAFCPENEPVSGDVYIGGGETRGMRLIARTAKQLHHTYPDIHCHLFSGNAEDVAERLEKGLLDFGIFVGRTDLSKYDSLKFPIADTWGLLMRKEDPLAELDRISPELIKKIPLLGSRQALEQNELSGWLGCDFRQLNIVSTYNLIYNASLMVEEGLGCAVTIEGLVNTSGSNLCFRPFAPVVTAELVISWKKYQVFSKAAEKFLETLQKNMEAFTEKDFL